MEFRVCKWPWGGWYIEKRAEGKKYWYEAELIFGVLDSQEPVIYKTEDEAMIRATELSLKHD